MKLFKPRTYTVKELAILKTCVLCFGMVAGAYVAPLVKRFFWIFLIVFLITYLRAMYFYWIKRDD